MTRFGVLSGVLFLGIVSVGAPIFAQPTPARKSPDVFLITIDTLRADHVGCYGYKDVETPALDALAADGARFTSAFTHSPITNTSHITILTGLLPSVHGVTDFGIPLAASHVTAAELLKGRGYHTAAFIGAVILDSNSLAPGLDRGFDFYDNFPQSAAKDTSPGSIATASGMERTPVAPRNSGGGNANATNPPRFGRVERRGMEVVSHAEAWFDKHRAGPHFVWVHLYDPHDPYEPPAPFSEKYKTHLYDGEIAYADSALGRWIAFLKKAGVYDNAIVVVTGDHGEGLGEHGEETHGLFLYDSTLHVPLIVKMPVKTPIKTPEQAKAAPLAPTRGLVIDAQVRTTDILPTILSVVGVPAPAELNGESLLPLIAQSEASPAASPRALFGETDYPLRWGWAPLRALRADHTKLIEAPRPELYDLRDDPKELTNLYAATRMNTQVQSIKEEMTQWEAKIPPRADRGESRLPDPKDKVVVQNLLHNAMLATDDNRTGDARQLLEKAVQLDPSSATSVRQLGEAEVAVGDFTGAAVHLKRATELRVDDSTAAFELGEALAKTGDWPGSRDALEASLRLAPSQMTARLLLGNVYLQLKDAKNAADQFEAALLVDSANSDARLGLAEAQIEQSDFADALADLEAFTKSDPRNASAWRLLARAYRGLGKEQEAVRADQRAAGVDKK